MKLLFDNFDMLAESPGGVEKLRKMILQLAVQGKLVPQESTDESATELLIRIAKSRAQAKLALNHKPVRTAITTMDRMPTGWAVASMGEICDVNMGQSPPGSSYNENGDRVPLINGPVEFTDGPFGTTFKRQYTNQPTKMCHKGDFLLCVRGSTTGRTNVAGFDACIGRGVAALKPYIDFGFFKWLVVSMREALYETGTGSTFKNISLDKICGSTVLLPPLGEQKRIVAKVDSLMSLCDEIEKQQQKKARRKRSLNKATLFALNTSENNQEFNKNWNHITKNFDLLYSTPENVNDLKQTILQLAVQGKLTEKWRNDNPNVEPARVLLEKIAKEKEKLIKEGKIKKQKPLPEITCPLSPI